MTSAPATALTPAELLAACDRLPRFALAHLPTPLEHLPRFSRVLGGPPIYIKRDDCTGLAFGGNKARHNEYLFGHALSLGTEIFVWGAGVQSNNCRQTAAACAKAGLDCHLVLGRGRPATGPDAVQGNLLLDHLVGAVVEIVEAGIGPDLDALIAVRADEYRARGRKVYNWDREICKPLAAISYVLCLLEIMEQTAQAGFRPGAVYVASAGSTGAGVALGKAALGEPILVRSVAPIRWPWDTQADMAHLVNKAAKWLQIPTCVSAEEIDVTHDYIGPGYGQASPGCLEAIALLARTEGILLDPIYSGKAMAALIDDVRQGRHPADQPLVFIHTGGTPALFVHSEELVAGIAPRKAV